MTFDELDKKMRIIDTAADQCVLPEIYMVARLDGRSFTRLTKELCKFEAPFDVQFRDLMINPVTNIEVSALRRRVRINYDLPMKDEYGQFVRSLIDRLESRQ